MKRAFLPGMIGIKSSSSRFLDTVTLTPHIVLLGVPSIMIHAACDIL
jgi:hypothetical protein